MLEAGVDEAGRGCLAGPVVAAAVILPPSFRQPLLNDSKKLTEKNRNFLRLIIESEAIAYSVDFVDNITIDKINVLNATYLAMHNAITKLDVSPGLLIVDGNRFRPYYGIPNVCVVGGDAIYASVAAASILAKTWRDEYMINEHKKYPDYGWNRNKGYATPFHVEALRKKGYTKLHRRSFHLKSDQLSLSI